MNQSDVTDWLLDELSSVLSTSSLVSLSTPSAHVDVADAHDEQTYPFVGVRFISGDAQSAGVGQGDLYVDHITYDDNDIVESVVRRKDITLRLSVIPVTDHAPALRDDLSDEIADHLSLVAEKGEHPEDIDDISPEEATLNGRPDEGVRGQGIPVEIEYSRYLIDDNVTAAETVNLNIDVDDGDENTDPADAVDTTV